jgi:hypothetical protein
MYEKLLGIFPDDQLVFIWIKHVQPLLHIIQANPGIVFFGVIFPTVNAVIHIEEYGTIIDIQRNLDM